MTYETMDWAAEANRVAAAFTIAQPCEFHIHGSREESLRDRWLAQHWSLFEPNEERMELRSVVSDESGDTSQHTWPFSFFGYRVCVAYKKTTKIFHCMLDGETEEFITVKLPDDGPAKITSNVQESELKLAGLSEFPKGVFLVDLRNSMAEALFKLGLYSAEIEASLGVTFDDHTKTLTLRYFERELWLKQHDWTAESIKVAAAFGVNGPFQFAQEVDKGKNYPGWSASGMVGTLQLSVSYSQSYLQFTLRDTNPDSYAYMYIRLWPNGDVQDRLSPNLVRVDDATALAKGLFNLNLLTPEVEAALQVTISNHQKLEWQLGYEARWKAA